MASTAICIYLKIFKLCLKIEKKNRKQEIFVLENIFKVERLPPLPDTQSLILMKLDR